MLTEHDRLHVGQLHHAVDDGEMGVGEFLADLLQRNRLGKADGNDRVLAALGKPAQRLLELGLVGRLEVSDGDLGLVGEPLGPIGDALIEGFVELAAVGIDDRRLERGLRLRQADADQQRDQRNEQPFHAAPLIVAASVDRAAALV